MTPILWWAILLGQAEKKPGRSGVKGKKSTAEKFLKEKNIQLSYSAVKKALWRLNKKYFLLI